MKDISVREFKSKLSFYLTLLSTGEEILVRGLRLKDVSNLDENSAPKSAVTTQNEGGDYAKEEKDVVTPPEMDEKKRKIAYLREQIAQVDAKHAPVTTQDVQKVNNMLNDDSVELPECCLCHLPRATRLVWEDGEEHKVCEPCLFKKYGTQAKGMIRRMAKL